MSALLHVSFGLTESVTPDGVIGRRPVWVNSERGSSQAHQMTPPLTLMTCPFTQWPAGLARNATASAVSCGIPRRSRGAAFAKESICSADLPSRKHLGGGRPRRDGVDVDVAPAE